MNKSSGTSLGVPYIDFVAPGLLGTTAQFRRTHGTADTEVSALRNVANDHWRSEQRIERSGLDFAFLRPSFYMQNLLGTVAPTVAASGPVSARVLPIRIGWPAG